MELKVAQPWERMGMIGTRKDLGKRGGRGDWWEDTYTHQRERGQESGYGGGKCARGRRGGGRRGWVERGSRYDLGRKEDGGTDPWTRKHTGWQGELGEEVGGSGGAVAEPASVDEDPQGRELVPRKGVKRIHEIAVLGRGQGCGNSVGRCWVQGLGVTPRLSGYLRNLLAKAPRSRKVLLPSHWGKNVHRGSGGGARRMKDRRGGRSGGDAMARESTSEQGNNATTRVT